MAAGGIGARLGGILSSLKAKLPFLKKALPGSGSSPEPFDTLEDATLAPGEDFEPNAALGLGSGAKGKAKSSAADRREAFANFWEALVRSPLALGLLAGALLLILALCVVAVVVASPPKAASAVAGRNAGKSTEAALSDGSYSEAGAALVRGLILPPRQGIEARVELERPLVRVYTVEDAEPYRTNMGKVDIEDLEAAREAAIRDLYGTVP